MEQIHLLYNLYGNVEPIFIHLIFFFLSFFTFIFDFLKYLLFFKVLFYCLLSQILSRDLNFSPKFHLLFVIFLRILFLIQIDLLLFFLLRSF